MILRILRRDFTRFKGLADMMGKYIFLSLYTPSVDKIFFLGEQKFLIGGARVAHEPRDELAVLGFFGIVRVIGALPERLRYGFAIIDMKWFYP